MAAAAGRYRVLVVEDEYFIATEISRALGRIGAEVVGPVATAAAAMETVSGGDVVDFAILDINLRGDVNFSAARHLMERGVPFVFATGYGSAVIPAEFAQIERWEKPFDADELVRRIAALGMAEAPPTPPGQPQE